MLLKKPAFAEGDGLQPVRNYSKRVRLYIL
jgi:hypothetical protein